MLTALLGTSALATDNAFDLWYDSLSPAEVDEYNATIEEIKAMVTKMVAEEPEALYAGDLKCLPEVDKTKCADLMGLLLIIDTDIPEMTNLRWGKYGRIGVSVLADLNLLDDASYVQLVNKDSKNRSKTVQRFIAQQEATGAKMEYTDCFHEGDSDGHACAECCRQKSHAKGFCSWEDWYFWGTSHCLCMMDQMIGSVDELFHSKSSYPSLKSAHWGFDYNVNEECDPLRQPFRNSKPAQLPWIKLLEISPMSTKTRSVSECQYKCRLNPKCDVYWIMKEYGACIGLEMSNVHDWYDGAYYDDQDKALPKYPMYGAPCKGQSWKQHYGK